MKNKIQISHQVILTKKPPKAEISEAEFRRRLKNIDEWRKNRLAERARRESALRSMCRFAMKTLIKKHCLGLSANLRNYAAAAR